MFLDVSLMYFVCILTLPEQCAWRCGDTRIYLCTHNTPQLVGYVLNAPQILDQNTYEYIQIHVSSRYSWGVYSTHFRGKTQPSPAKCRSPKPQAGGPRAHLGQSAPSTPTAPHGGPHSPPWGPPWGGMGVRTPMGGCGGPHWDPIGPGWCFS